MIWNFDSVKSDSKLCKKILKLWHTQPCIPLGIKVLNYPSSFLWVLKKVLKQVLKKLLIKVLQRVLKGELKQLNKQFSLQKAPKKIKCAQSNSGQNRFVFLSKFIPRLAWHTTDTVRVWVVYISLNTLHTLYIFWKGVFIYSEIFTTKWEVWNKSTQINAEGPWTIWIAYFLLLS